jgi:hypothetical protein
MHALAREVDQTRLPPGVANAAKPGQVFVTVGKRYEVCAVAVFAGRPKLQVVDDLGYPAWIPAWLFDVADPALPANWICNVFREEPALVMGPEFIAKDHDAYASMVEREADQVDRFWKRVEALRPNELGESD